MKFLELIEEIKNWCSGIDQREFESETEVAIKEKNNITDKLTENQLTPEILKNDILQKENIGKKLFSNDDIKYINKYICDIEKQCGKEGLQSILRAVDFNAHTSILGEAINNQNKKTANLFLQRLVNVSHSIKNIYNQYGHDYFIVSSGSDFHRKGKHVLFLIPKESAKKNKKLVHKPRSLNVDSTIIGKTTTEYRYRIIISFDSEEKINVKEEWAENGGMLEQFSKILVKTSKEEKNSMGKLANYIDDEPFGIMGITGESDGIGNKNNVSGKVDFLERKKIFNSDESEKFFFKLGMLEATARVMNIGDLHAENIMPNEKGTPTIIDAEVCFFNRDNLNDNSKNLINLRDARELENNNFSFKIKIGNAEKTAYEVYNEKLRPYYDLFLEGYNFMAEKLKKSVEELVIRYKMMLNKLSKIRIVPLDTSELKWMMPTQFGKEGEKEEIKIICLIVNNLKEFKGMNTLKGQFNIIFEYECCESKNNIKSEDIINQKLKIKEALSPVLQRGEIPMFYIDIGEKENDKVSIVLEDTEIAHFEKENKILTKSGIIDYIIRGKYGFIESIKNLKTKNK